MDGKGNGGGLRGGGLRDFNRGAMPREMFLEQLRRFARDVLPILQAHQIVAGPADAGQRMPE